MKPLCRSNGYAVQGSAFPRAYLALDKDAAMVNFGTVERCNIRKEALTRMKIFFNIVLILGLTMLAAQAQDQVPPPMPGYETLSGPQLDQLLGPIALYPDDLISIMLPAATFPTEIVMADRYVSGGGDPNQIDQQSWDPSVQALAHYPDVLKWMDDNLSWTTQLGQAFQNQQQDVMDSIQRLRLQAYNLGNLQSTPQLQVINDNGYIEIVPANPDDVPIPQYQPDQVYYQPPYGAPFITFAIMYPIGPWLCYDFDWTHHRMMFWDRDHPRPGDWWHESPQQRDDYFARQPAANVWRPQSRAVYSNQGDRGWSAPAEPRPEYRTGTVPSVNRPAPAPAEQFAPNESRPDAFVGSQDTRDTQNYSDRGYHSVETTHPSSWFHTSAPEGGFHGGGSPAPSRGAPSGGGGFHGGGGSPPSGGGGGHH